MRFKFTNLVVPVAAVVLTVSLASLMAMFAFKKVPVAAPAAPPSSPPVTTAVTEQKPPAGSDVPAAAPACADLPRAVPATGWNAIATVPGTGVSFRYPKGGFFGAAPAVVALASGKPGLLLGTFDEPTDLPFVFPSFTAQVTLTDTPLIREQLLAAAINTDEDQERGTRKYAVTLNDRLFLITADGFSTLRYTALTAYGDRTVGISTEAGSWCGGASGPMDDALFLDFLRNMEFE